MKYVFTAVIAFLVVLNLPAAGTSVQARTALTPDETVRRFYQVYLQSLNQKEEPLAKRRAELSKLVTQRLMRSYYHATKRDTGINADFFIDAQDWDAAWANNISISKAKIQGSRAVVTVTLKGGVAQAGSQRFDNKLKVGLRKEGGVWKIDSVNGRSNVT